uniref:Claudin n=1 Tax=Hippocampus comes TaxID=109280 RepID=A0A3Q2YLX8_HIPCM
MRDILEISALSLGFLGWIMVSVSLQDQYWKESSNEGSVITTSTIYENLWVSCASDSTGIYNCRDFPSLLALPGKSNSFNNLIWC